MIWTQREQIPLNFLSDTMESFTMEELLKAVNCPSDTAVWTGQNSLAVFKTVTPKHVIDPLGKL